MYHLLASPGARVTASLEIQAWVGTVAPQGELSIPFEYVTEWPVEKETEIIEK